MPVLAAAAPDCGLHMLQQSKHSLLCKHVCACSCKSPAAQSALAQPMYMHMRSATDKHKAVLPSGTVLESPQQNAFLLALIC